MFPLWKQLLIESSLYLRVIRRTENIIRQWQAFDWALYWFPANRLVTLFSLFFVPSALLLFISTGKLKIEALESVQEATRRLGQWNFGRQRERETSLADTLQKGGQTERGLTSWGLQVPFPQMVDRSSMKYWSSLMDCWSPETTTFHSRCARPLSTTRMATRRKQHATISSREHVMHYSALLAPISSDKMWTNQCRFSHCQTFSGGGRRIFWGVWNFVLLDTRSFSHEFLDNFHQNGIAHWRQGGLQLWWVVSCSFIYLTWLRV